MAGCVLDATIFDPPGSWRHPRCAACTEVPYVLCAPCTASYAAGSSAPLCPPCAAGNRDLARHAQRHSVVLGMCLDDGICDLVEAAVVFGARTVGSCVGSPPVALGRPYVGFASLDDVEAVVAAALVAAVEATDGELEGRILGVASVPARDRWSVSMLVTRDGPGLRLFPHLDLPEGDVAWLAEVLGATPGAWHGPS